MDPSLEMEILSLSPTEIITSYVIDRRQEDHDLFLTSVLPPSRPHIAIMTDLEMLIAEA